MLAVYDTQTGTPVGGRTLSTLEGAVVDLGEGRVPADWFAAPDAGEPLDSTGTHWLRIDGDGGAGWTVVSERVPLGFGVHEGSKVLASFMYEYGHWSPTRSSLTLWVDGQLAYFFATDGRPGDIEFPPGVSAVPDRVLCQGSSMCGRWDVSALSITVDGESAVLETDEQETVGDYDLWHARTARSQGPTQCQDWFVADSTLAIARHSPLSAAKAQCDEDAGGQCAEDAGR